MLPALVCVSWPSNCLAQAVSPYVVRAQVNVDAQGRNISGTAFSMRVRNIVELWSGRAWSPATMEAFWSTLKREAMEDSEYWTKDRTRRELFQYIEVDYNRSRFHSSLGYQSPVDFEQQNN